MSKDQPIQRIRRRGGGFLVVADDPLIPINYVIDYMNDGNRRWIAGDFAVVPPSVVGLSVGGSAGLIRGDTPLRFDLVVNRLTGGRYEFVSLEKLRAWTDDDV